MKKLENKKLEKNKLQFENTETFIYEETNRRLLNDIKIPLFKSQFKYFQSQEMLGDTIILPKGNSSSALDQYTISRKESTISRKESTEIKITINSNTSLKRATRQIEQSNLLSPSMTGRVKEYASLLFQSYEEANTSGKYAFSNK